MRVELARRDRWLAGMSAGGVLGALACVLVWPRAALAGWLAAAIMLQAIPLGALTLLAMMQLIRGEWEAELRPVCEAAAFLLPAAALAFVPVLVGMAALYDWDTHPAESPFQAAWLAYLPFALRTIAWFAALAVIARSQLRGASEGASALALIVIALGASFVAVDWLMSLDPGFHSSGFGLQLLSIELAAAYAALLLARLLLLPAPRRPSLLGGLLLTFLLLWIYFQFMPLLVIWSGNLPEGAAWYLRRAGGTRDLAIWAFAVLGGVPLLALLLPQVRSRPRLLVLAAASTLAGKAIELAWFAVPGRAWPAAPAFVLALAGFAALAAVVVIRRMAPRGADA